MGELHHEKARRNRREPDRCNDDNVVPIACEVSFNLRIPDYVEVGRWDAESALETLCELRGWKRSDRIERHGSEAELLHLIYDASGCPETARNSLKRLISHLESLELWKEEEIGLDAWVTLDLY